MLVKFAASFFICFALLGCQTFEQPLKSSKPAALNGDSKFSLDGQWQFLPSNTTSSNYYSQHADFSKFKQIKVPSNWYTQGYDHHGVAWYKRTFMLPETSQTELVHKLVFGGVDYFADVWLNGHYLGFHEGYFQSFEFDISAHLKPGMNSLVVKVNSPLEDPGQSWSLHKQYIKGVLGHHDTRPGGAWSDRGQEQNTGGIWQSVWIERTQLASIDQIKFTPKVTTDLQASAEIELLLSAKRDDSVELEYQLYFGQELVESNSKLISINTGSQSANLSIPSKSRKLWSPWEHGTPKLYQLKINVKKDGNLLATKELEVGFRQFELDEKTGVWLVNHKPLFVRGTNYIAWQWLADFSTKDFVKDLELMKQANINAVRVHAHVLPPRFYQQANKLGLVIWQDFPLQWGYVDTEEFIQNAEKQAIEMVEQYYNHPSILVWSAHNEPPWDADWMKYMYKDYNNKQNIELDERVLLALQSADKSRYSHKSSLTAEHPWLGWYSGKWTDYLKPTKQKWVTEFGAQALPDKTTLTEIVGADNLWPSNEKQWAIWDYHNFQQEQTFNIAKVEKGNNVDELIANTQNYQSKLTSLAAESYRRQKGKPVNAIFQFMFVEDWASMNWGVVDYKRQPKPGYFALQQAYQPLLPSIEYQPSDKPSDCCIELGLWVVNDHPKTFTAYQLKYEVYRQQELIYQQSMTRDISASSSEKAMELKLNKLDSGSYLIKWQILDSRGQQVAENTHKWQVE